MQEILAPYNGGIGEMISRCRADGKPRGADLEAPRERPQTASCIELSLNLVAPQLLLGAIDEVTESERSVAAAQQLAMSDPLTGLLNRRGLEAAMEHALPMKSLHGELAVLAIDLDHFKEVNDTLGHEAGDRVLHHAAREIAAAVRRSDLVARLGAMNSSRCCSISGRRSRRCRSHRTSSRDCSCPATCGGPRRVWA